jgi:hypothetical protein
MAGFSVVVGRRFSLHRLPVRPTRHRRNMARRVARMSIRTGPV